MPAGAAAAAGDGGEFLGVVVFSVFAVGDVLADESVGVDDERDKKRQAKTLPSASTASSNNSTSGLLRRERCTLTFGVGNCAAKFSERELIGRLSAGVPCPGSGALGRLGGSAETTGGGSGAGGVNLGSTVAGVMTVCSAASILGGASVSTSAFGSASGGVKLVTGTGGAGGSINVGRAVNSFSSTRALGDGGSVCVRNAPVGVCLFTLPLLLLSRVRPQASQNRENGLASAPQY